MEIVNLLCIVIPGHKLQKLRWNLNSIIDMYYINLKVDIMIFYLHACQLRLTGKHNLTIRTHYFILTLGY